MAAIALYALGFPAAEILLQDWGVIALIALRNILGLALLLAVWPLLESWRNIQTAPWVKGLKIGGFGFGFGSALLLLTQWLTNGVTAALAAACMPVIAVAMEVVLDGRRLSAHFVAGVCLVLVGGLLASGLDVSNARFGIGLLLGLLATVLFTWGSRATVKGLPGVSQYTQVVVTTAGMAAVTTLAFVVMSMLSLPLAHTATLALHGWMLLLVYAWLSLAISQTLWIHSVERLGIGVASFHLNATPFYVMLLFVAMGGDWRWTQAVGAVILAIGVVLSQREPARLE